MFMTIDRTNLTSPMNYFTDSSQNDEHIASNDLIRSLEELQISMEKIPYLHHLEEIFLKMSTEFQVDALNENQKIALVEDLENAIANKHLNTKFAKAINVLRYHRNRIFFSVNQPENSFSTLPNDVMEKLILGHTTPKQVEEAKLLNKELKKTATHLAKILSINNGRFKLKRCSSL